MPLLVSSGLPGVIFSSAGILNSPFQCLPDMTWELHPPAPEPELISLSL